MSEKNIENTTRSDINFAPTFNDHHLLSELTFNGHCLTKNNTSITKKAMNLYISYTLTPWLRNLKKDFTLNSCSFGPAKLTKNADPDR